MLGFVDYMRRCGAGGDGAEGAVRFGAGERAIFEGGKSEGGHCDGMGIGGRW